MINRFWSGIVLVLMLTGCGSGGAPTRHNDFTPLTSIEIVAIAPSIAAGTSTKLSVIGNFSGQFTGDITSQVVWTSDTPTVAGFSTPASPNRVTSHTPGVATLTATKGNVTTSFRLTITSATVTALTITPVAPSVSKGLTSQFAASGTFSDLTTQDLTVDAAWTSSTPTVATISNAINSEGLAQALTAGTTTISAAFNGISSTTLMTVTTPIIQSITVAPVNSTILSVSTEFFQAIEHFSDGSTADISSQVVWSSSVPTIASITSGGAATALLPGTTVIRASLPGISGETTMKVSGGSLTGITLAPASSSLVLGAPGRITATGSFSNGTTRDISGLVEWSVADPSIATVSTSGGHSAQVNALKVTPALVPTTISATFGSIIAKTNLTVTNPSLQSITLSPTSLDLSVGTTGRMTVTGTFFDGTTQDLTAIASWTSSNSAAASAGDTGTDKGRISGVAASATPVTITAGIGGKTNTAVVSVKQRSILNITITPSITSLIAGSQVQFTVTANFSDGSSQIVTEDAVLSINAPNVAILVDSLNLPGLVWLVDVGSTTLSATFGGKIQSVILNVH